MKRVAKDRCRSAPQRSSLRRSRGEGDHPKGGGGVSHRFTGNGLDVGKTPPPCSTWSPSPSLRDREDLGKRRLQRFAKCLAAPLLALLLASATAPTNPYLDDSPGDDWPGFGRSYGEQHYSPLAQIDGNTVGRLGLAWSYDLPAQNPMSGPVAAQGLLFTATGYSVVRAFDVETGKLRWEVDTGTPEKAGPRMRYAWGIRGLAWWQGKIYVGTVDGRLIALDARTGKQRWSVQSFEPGMIANLTGAPRIFDGKVIIGFGGADYAAVRGYVTAYDAESGKQLWRFYTVPGNPAVDHDETTQIAAKTWSGEWWKYGGGGTAWNAFSYDPETDTVFVGTGNGGPWNHRIRSEGKGDNLFLCSIIALDAKTGRYKWHVQQNPGETWDYNAVMDMQFATLTIDGRPRKVLMQAPKNGFFYVIDRITGEILSAEPFAKVTWASKVDLKTGRPVELPGARFENGARSTIWPSLEGAHNWLPMAFSPRTNLVYLPTLDMPASYDDRGIDPKTWAWGPGGRNEVGVNVGLFTPELLKDAKATLQAWDPVARKAVWTLPAFGLWSGSALATGGGLVFNGQANGLFRAIDDRSGKILWSFDAKAPVIAPPISYRWKGRQYVSVITGYGTSQAVYDATHLVAENFATQARRVLTFALDGQATLPPRPAPVPVEAQPDPDFRPDQAKWIRGVTSYHQQCVICHGVMAVGVGTAPDLRGSAVPLSAEAFREVVHGGALVPAGMPQFSQLPDDEVEAIRHFLRAQAKELAAAK
jgi:quinohemoprotein ethanol dehydrogenase